MQCSRVAQARASVWNLQGMSSQHMPLVLLLRPGEAILAWPSKVTLLDPSDTGCWDLRRQQCLLLPWPWWMCCNCPGGLHITKYNADGTLVKMSRYERNKGALPGGSDLWLFLMPARGFFPSPVGQSRILNY